MAGKLEHQPAQRDEDAGEDAKCQNHLDQRDSALETTVRG
jgi:hypothetical protein